MAVKSVNSTMSTAGFVCSGQLPEGLYESNNGHIYLVNGTRATRVYRPSDVSALSHPIGGYQNVSELRLRKYNGTITLSNE
jgi:hypothetical protein